MSVDSAEHKPLTSEADVRYGAQVPQRSKWNLPERFAYRVKNKMLGPPLNSDRLAHETLGKPTALAVFASDNLSSSAYATEEILHVLIPVIGIGAFGLVLPITVALLGVLGILILSYRQTIKAYPSAGGAYIVTKDNFGLLAAQIAGVALLTDYILTVAVSTAAGTAALTSVFGGLARFAVPISISFVLIIAYGNLRGVKESGRVFAVPTYFFIINMFALLAVGIFKYLSGDIHPQPTNLAGMDVLGPTSAAIWGGASLSLILKAFASGGAAVTGVEAISNGVPAFREPSWKNARQTLVVMGTLLGAMFLGLSFLASKIHPVPYESGSPTVISQIGKYIYGTHGIGDIFYICLQAGTMLILVLAANTSFADFPRLASFAAGDNFMPRQLMKRGHRLVFSNGVITLSLVSIILLLATDAKVSRLIPLYAIGVFTSFTLSQAGMAKHHWRLREPGWHWGIVCNGFGAFVTLIVTLVIAKEKFLDGAWVIIVAIPIMVWGLFRLNRQYEKEDRELEKDVQQSAESRALPRHVVFVLIDHLNVAAARAMQYAKSLNPNELRAIHFDIDPLQTKVLADRWSQLGLSRFPLEIIECPDRRLARATGELVLETIADNQTEVTVLIPRLEHRHWWHGLLHDKTANRIAQVLPDIPHCNVTLVPYHVGGADALAKELKGATGVRMVERRSLEAVTTDGVTIRPIGSLDARERVTIEGTIHAVRVQPWSGVAALECVLEDRTGRINVVFVGRRQIAGVEVGARLRVEGVVGNHHRQRAILNPSYLILGD